MKQAAYHAYIQILEEELILALGCTEPICLALAGARIREVLGKTPETVAIEISGQLFKNANSVCIPNADGLKGIAAAVVLGMVGGDSSLGLEVLSNLSAADTEKARQLLADPQYCTIRLLKTGAKLHLIVTAQSGADSAVVEILHRHTNIARVIRNGEVLFDSGDTAASEPQEGSDRSCLNIQSILEFGDAVAIKDIEPLLRRQVDTNLRISNEGMAGEYGAQIGRSLIAFFGDDVKSRARAAAAAGSDARMSGCPLPVVINSGSGNQGITVCLPIVVYAEQFNIADEMLLRSLAVANLTAIHLKTKVGRLSAYCGVVSAACAAGAGITYMLGGTYEQVVKTISNTLANVSGIICDGAKASCAAKIASAVDAALIGHAMAMQGLSFQSGDGIVKADIERTIAGVSSIAAEGMLRTDDVVLRVVLGDDGKDKGSGQNDGR